MPDDKVVSMTVKDIKEIVQAYIDWFACGYPLTEEDYKLVEEEIKHRNVG